jgi:hypothetical protein
MRDEIKGIACTATFEQVDQLLYLVENVTGYRDWDWLTQWLDGSSFQEWIPESVIKIYSNHDYWVAVQSGDVVEVNNIRNAILGTN